ncbi:MAG: ATP-binding protein [Gammaproteobacteria bacterium]|nr:ATP-binding protein [Gammaproteobacteria bacterium]
MSKASLKNLFHPGDGRIPPYFAGRGQERQYFQDCVDLLMRKSPLDQNMIIYGPRGNGKTAMLRYLQKETLRQTDNKIEVFWVTPSEFKDLGELASLIIGNDQSLFQKVQNLFKPLLDNFSVAANVGAASIATSLNRPRVMLALKALFLEKSRNKPFILIMDEAHTLDPDMARVLLNASQDIRVDGCLFFLVLAGTPNLRTELCNANATFWSRSELFPLGRLSHEDSYDALTIPLKLHQVTFSQEAESGLLSRVHRYPYFIQVWGNCIANRLYETDSLRVTMDTIREVEKTAMMKCDQMYLDRYGELREMSLRPLANHIAQAFSKAEKEYIPEKEFEKLIGKALEDQGAPATNESIRKNIRNLLHIGYVWEISVPNEEKGGYSLVCYEPGIPSLMTFVIMQM